MHRLVLVYKLEVVARLREPPNRFRRRKTAVKINCMYAAGTYAARMWCVCSTSLAPRGKKKAALMVVVVVVVGLSR